MSIQMKCAKATFGNERAAWCVCPTDFSDKSIVYSFGVGDDVSFELELIRRFGLSVHAFDPTPRAIEWVNSQTFPAQFRFHNYGLADYDGDATFNPPHNAGHVSYKMFSSHAAPPSSIVAPVRRLTHILAMLGHERLALLKIDIEGAEYSIIQDLVCCSTQIDQLLIEFHHRWRENGIEKTRKAVRQLNRAGYFIFHVSPSGEEYGLRRIHNGLQ